MAARSEPERLFAQALYEIRLLLGHYLGSSAVESLKDADLCVRQAAHLAYALHNDALRSLAGETVDMGPALASLAAVDSMLQSDFVQRFAEQGLHQLEETLMTKPEPPGEFGRAVPIFRVASLEASLAYYVEVLGFQVDWKVEGYASVHRGKASLMLSVGDQGHPGTWIWIAVEDADALEDELRAKGAVIRHPPTNYPWGSRELHVTDPDGHVLRLGADLKKGEPMGEWLDGEGRRWLSQPDGGWKAAE